MPDSDRACPHGSTEHRNGLSAKIYKPLHLIRGRPPLVAERLPRLRVSPLNPQVAIALRPGDPVFRPPEAGGFVQLCLSDPLPVLTCPFRASTGASKPFGEVVPPDISQRAGSRSNHDLSVPGFTSSAKTKRPWKCNSEGGWFLVRERYSRGHLPPRTRFASSGRCDPACGYG